MTPLWFNVTSNVPFIKQWDIYEDETIVRLSRDGIKLPTFEILKFASQFWTAEKNDLGYLKTILAESNSTNKPELIMYGRWRLGSEVSKVKPFVCQVSSEIIIRQ